ncbi:hypothetical protein ACEV60_03160 [Enterobacter ludwigii]|uniref:hypothetical protein n=1 Tax=Enterobacter ludwigii TaxID=299767 RepID=UPI003BEEF54A
MSTLIKRWDIILQMKEAYESDIPPSRVGSQMDNEPDIRSGFLIVRNGNDIHGVPMDRIHAFSIIAVKDE